MMKSKMTSADFAVVLELFEDTDKKTKGHGWNDIPAPEGMKGHYNEESGNANVVSTDKYTRLKEGWKWFPSEQPSPDDRLNAEKRIEECNHRFDVVLSHTCPKKFIGDGLKHVYAGSHEIDLSTEERLDDIEDRIVYSHWYFGHFQKYIIINYKVTAVYDDVIKI